MNDGLHFDDLAQVRLSGRPVHLAIGIFDGVHLGHRAVITAAVEAARRSGGLAGVLTFWPHPSAVLRPDHAVRMILPRAVKRRLLLALGIDFLVEQAFTPDYARTTAPEFVAWLKRCVPGLEAVYVGENWRFGRGRSGDVAALLGLAQEAGFAVHCAPSQTAGGAPINSSRIRELLASGGVGEANQLLGYSYFSEGVVEPGRQLGRTIGFPTLNLRWEPDLQPRLGIYAVMITGPTGRPERAVASFGVRPTVEDQGRPLLEVHVLGPTAITYGDAVRVDWIRYLRPEEKFPSLEALRVQIAKDCDEARAVLDSG